MRNHEWLKYARREGSDVLLTCRVADPGTAGDVGGLRIRKLSVTDGVATAVLVVFGADAARKYAPGMFIRAGPVYWDEGRGNFALKRGGGVSIVGG